MSVAQADSYLVVGKIIAVRGLQGEVKVHSFTDPIANLLNYKVWTLRLGQQEQVLKVVSARQQNKVLIAKLQGLHDCDQARALVGFEILVARSELPVLAINEYYWHQLQGLQVSNQQGQCLGRIAHLLETGANDVMVVKPSADSIDQRERLLPYTTQCVVRVDLTAVQLVVDWDADF